MKTRSAHGQHVPGGRAPAAANSLSASVRQKRPAALPIIHRPAFTAQRQLQRAVEASPRQLRRVAQLRSMFGPAVQLASAEEEELLQGKFDPVQRQGDLEDEELLQGRFEPVQRIEEEESLQGKFTAQGTTQLKPDRQDNANNTGLPDNLKSGVEALSGMSMDNVRVHYNSSKPAQLNALAYAQGTDIHVASGQERHLPHEAWHVVQQAQGRVKPTMQMKEGVPVNDDASLEKEADVMGEKALSRKGADQA